MLCWYCSRSFIYQALLYQLSSVSSSRKERGGYILSEKSSICKIIRQERDIDGGRRERNIDALKGEMLTGLKTKNVISGRASVWLEKCICVENCEMKVFI